VDPVKAMRFLAVFAMSVVCLSLITARVVVDEAGSWSASGGASSAVTVMPSETLTSAELQLASRRLTGLKTAPRSERGSYERAAFGGWARSGGCSTRERVLRVQLQHLRIRDGCVVASGVLTDPYTGATIRYTHGGGGGVDIDHVVTLRNAWQTGAARWAPGRRAAFANDGINLLATGAEVNRSKGDAPVDAWLPPRRQARCAYAARVVAVKSRWSLTVTRTEATTLGRLLAKCSTR
jgi:hypothetical protein